MGVDVFALAEGLFGNEPQRLLCCEFASLSLLVAADLRELLSRLPLRGSSSSSDEGEREPSSSSVRTTNSSPDARP